VFLEHVRARPTYDPEDFRQEVLRESERYGMEAQVGFEARILRGGRLDISSELLRVADVVGIAEHGYEGDGSTLAEDFTTLVLDTLPSHPKQTFVWVHPGSWLQRHAWTDTGAYQEMFDVASRSPVLIERNLKYNLIDEEGVASLPQQKVVIGLDAHSVDEAVTRWRLAGGE
jgi:histidinol phosphatase-like PHP family hydrolase